MIVVICMATVKGKSFSSIYWSFVLIEIAGDKIRDNANISGTETASLSE